MNITASCASMAARVSIAIAGNQVHLTRLHCERVLHFQPTAPLGEVLENLRRIRADLEHTEALLTAITAVKKESEVPA